MKFAKRDLGPGSGRRSNRQYASRRPRRPVPNTASYDPGKPHARLVPNTLGPLLALSRSDVAPFLEDEKTHRPGDRAPRAHRFEHQNNTERERVAALPVAHRSAWRFIEGPALRALLVLIFEIRVSD